MLFTFGRPGRRDLGESILLLALLSRFVIADPTDPRSVPAELQLIVPNAPSVLIQPIINGDQEPYPVFENLLRRDNVLPIFRFKNAQDLSNRFEAEVLRPLEQRIARSSGRAH